VIGHLDCSTGVSGDKVLGALLDAGSTDGRFTEQDLARIASGLAPEARVVVERRNTHGISAVGVRVVAEGQPRSRTWAAIREALAGADLPSPVAERAQRAFGALAEAEARVHGTTVDDVHFHEVGAIDSIVDIVGVCAGLHALDVTSLVASPVAVGSGTVETSHGVLPVPAPATAELLRGTGALVVAGPAEGELTTPTGAALLGACVERFSAMPSMRIGLVGYGAGTRDIGIPNVCRIILAEQTHGSSGEPASESVAVVECNLDHLAAEELAFACDELLALGALDVWQTPIVMKKGRSAVMLSVLVAEADAPHYARLVTSLTGSLGVRVRVMERFVAPRDVIEVVTAWGPVRVKVGVGRMRPEHDDVARIARETGVPYAEVARAAGDAARGDAGTHGA